MMVVMSLFYPPGKNERAGMMFSPKGEVHAQE